MGVVPIVNENDTISVSVRICCSFDMQQTGVLTNLRKSNLATTTRCLLSQVP